MLPTRPRGQGDQWFEQPSVGGYMLRKEPIISGDDNIMHFYC